MLKRFLIPALTFAFVVSAAAQQATPTATERIDSAMNDKIKAEGMERSKIMWIEHFLTDARAPSARPITSPPRIGR